MKNINKRSLYENIMKEISKTVKSKLNENIMNLNGYDSPFDYNNSDECEQIINSFRDVIINSCGCDSDIPFFEDVIDAIMETSYNDLFDHDELDEVCSNTDKTDEYIDHLLKEMERAWNSNIINKGNLKFNTKDLKFEWFIDIYENFITNNINRLYQIIK